MLSEANLSKICKDDLSSFPWAFVTEDIQTLNPYHITILACHVVALLTFTVSTLTGNLSQVDKLWSILPCMYAWMCSGDGSSRTTLMAVLTTLWSIRLTYNFYRRGGYTWPKVWLGEEDYRWSILRQGSLGGVWALLKNRWVLLIFNIVFISLIQNWLLFWIATPSLVAWSASMKAIHCADQYPDFSADLNSFDGIASILFLTALVIESIADNQQFNFQAKKRLQKQPTQQFCTDGFFSIVRKPNYAAEQFIWFSYYIFSVAASSTLWNWTGGGILSLIVLFQGSGWLTEQITVGKYPEYEEYQRIVPIYVPNMFALLSGKQYRELEVLKNKKV